MLEVFSVERSALSVNAVRFIATIQEARRILQSEGREVRVSPVYSMEKVLRQWLEQLGTDTEAYKWEQFDAMKDLSEYYDLWRPAMVKAHERIYGTFA